MFSILQIYLFTIPSFALRRSNSAYIHAFLFQSVWQAQVAKSNMAFSNRRASLDDFRRRLILKSLKVIYEELAKLHHFLFEVSLA